MKFCEKTNVFGYRYHCKYEILTVSHDYGMKWVIFSWSCDLNMVASIRPGVLKLESGNHQVQENARGSVEKFMELKK